MSVMSRRTAIAAGVSLAAIGAAGYSLWPRMDGYLEEVERQRRMLAAVPDLGELVRMATLAANGHNTQPWKFRLGDGSVSLLPDLTRRTAVVDPDDHHLYVSLGCAAENLVIAAAASGRAAESSTVTDGGMIRIDTAFSPAPATRNALFDALPLRQSTRSSYDGQPIPSDDLRRLRESAREDGVSVEFFTEPSDRETILDFVVAGNSNQMDDPAFVAELRDWLRFNPDHAVAAGDGLFSACSGNPVAPDWIGLRLFDAFFTKEEENAKYAEQIRSSAGIAVFVGDHADPQHWIKVGRSFERFALQATALGIRTAHINQPVEDLSVRADFAAWLGQPGSRPDLVIRFGRAPAMPMSLRRSVDRVLA